jgi:hypothetical protein
MTTTNTTSLAANARQTSMQATTATITLADRWDHFLARWGVNRNGHRVSPGLYSLGKPSAESPVLVTANYSLSFDALRAALAEVDSYILVLDTQGINVWCAAGKGTFSTDELVHRIEESGLAQVVSHRTLILPQLGATGVAAHEVKKRSGFRVEYGPVRAADLPEYLKTHQATSEMRRVRFDLLDRMVLIPVELVHLIWPTLAAAVVLYFLSGWLAALAAVAAVLAGAALFPILLPWIPTPNFSTKGFLLGLIVALPFAGAALLTNVAALGWRQVAGALSYLLAMPPLAAYLALNFTGSTPFTSKTGVQLEMFAYIPKMAWSFGAGVVLVLVVTFARLLGG